MTLIAVAAFAAGAVNSIAGGGTFLSFSALLVVGMPPVIANASNAVSLWPGSIAAAWGFRRELRRFSRVLPLLSAVAFVGGLCGGLLLLATSNAAFGRMVPWLLLLATGVFAFSGPLSAAVRRKGGRTHVEPENRQMGTGGYVFQFVVSVYGGFFGAGMGILMIAALAIQGFEDLLEVNALKNWLSVVIYSVAVATFVIAGAVSWPHTLVMLVTATVGGFVGAVLARRIPALWLRRGIIVIGALLSVYYFVDTP